MRSTRDTEFSEFVSARYQHLLRLAHAITGDHHRAEDVLQTALVKLYVAWPRVTRKGGEESYLRTIIVRTCIDESRRGWRREVSRGVVADAIAVTDHPEDRQDDLFTAIRGLPEMQRKVVVLRYWLDLSVEQTAAELDVSTGTVKSHASRGLSKLRSVLPCEL